MMITEEVLHRMEQAFSKPGTDTDRLNRAVAELRQAVTPDNQVARRLTEGEMTLIAGLIQVRVERAALKEKECAEWQETMDAVHAKSEQIVKQAEKDAKAIGVLEEKVARLRGSLLTLAEARLAEVLNK